MDSKDCCMAQLGWMATGRGDGNYVAPLCDGRPHTHVNSPLRVYRDVGILEDIDGVNWRGSPWVSVGKWDGAVEGFVQISNVPRYKE